MDERQLHQRLATLRARTLDSLVRLPGVHAVYLSGSLAGGTGDGYSDIDLQVLTADLPASLAALPAALGAVGAVDVAWELAESRDDWAATIIWRDESPYHRLDLGLTAAGAGEEPTTMPGASLAWRSDRPVEAQAEMAGAETERANAAPLPGVPAGTAAHLVLGHLIAGYRYAKGRRRGQALTCWRYATAASEWLAVLLYERSRGWAEHGRKLTTTEYLALDASLPAAETAAFLSPAGASMSAGMDVGICATLERIAALAAEKAAARGEPMPDETVARLLSMLRAELAPAAACPRDYHCGWRAAS